MPKTADIAKRYEKREQRAARLAGRIQSAAPFRTSSEITGLPNHEYAETTKTVERRGRKKQSFKALTHSKSCHRCFLEHGLPF